MNIKPATSNIGKHKIPRYLYHLTTESNYLSMLNEGNIKLGGEYDKVKGIYIIELANFFKRWFIMNKDGFSGNDLRQKLVKQVMKNSEGDIIILKIPTKNIDRDRLLIRNQNNLFKNYDYYVSKSDSAKNSGLYKQRKQAIEYIYPDEINISQVEKIGSTKVKIHTFAGVEFFSKLLKGTPEEKSIKLLKN